MAKSFPFFKFIATDWLTGDIVYEDLCVQGLFINICAIYWQRDGRLTIEEVNKRYKSPELLDKLKSGFIVVKKGKISIKFLDEQLRDAEHISKKNAERGAKGGRPKINKNKDETTSTHNDLENKELQKAMTFLVKAKKSKEEEEEEEEEEINKNKKENKNNSNFEIEISNRPKRISETVYQKFTEVWFDWHKSEFGFDPRFGGMEGRKIKLIISYFEKILNTDDPELLANKFLLVLGKIKEDDYLYKNCNLALIESSISKLVLLATRQNTNSKPEKNYVAAMEALELLKTKTNSNEVGTLDRG